MDLFTISVGESRKATNWKRETLSWNKLLDRLRDTTRTRETAAEYRRMGKDQQDAIKDVGGFIGGELTGPRRKGGCVKSRCLLTLDADFAYKDFWEDLCLLNSFACCLYSTHKHTPETPRLRLVIPLSRPVTAEEYPAIARKVADDIGIDLFDDTTYQPERLMYWPSTPADGEFIFRVQDGPPLDADEVLARYSDWRDVSLWPVSSRTDTARQHSAKKQGDPRAKDGLVGAFCRAYDIDAAIAQFLPETYLPCAAPGRYTYAGGSTVAGLVVYDDGRFAYSNHATDPASGLLCNSFDLVRLHRFGVQDDGADPKMPTQKRPSFKAMLELARTDNEVKKLMTGEQRAAAREEFGGGDASDAEDDLLWAAKLERDKRGQVAATIDNVVLILEHDPQLRGRLAYNAMKERLVCRQPMPWQTAVDTRNGTEWADPDDSALRHYLESVYQVSAPQKVFDAVSIVGQRAAYHPVREYLDGLVWDGVPRLERLLVDYLGAEDTPYTRAVTRKCLTAAVARIYQPGCKFDYMLVLVGKQGVGKSYLVARLSRGWYTDSLTCVQGKEAYEGIQGFWLVEMGELSALKKAEIEATKNFISKQVDTYRAAYGRRTVDHPRQCVFIGTTNSTNFLRDDTGNRRYWPVRLAKGRETKDLFKDLTDAEIDQIWAEARRCYELGERLFLPTELAEEATQVQEDFTEEDPRAGEVRTYLDTLLPADWAQRDAGARRSYLCGEFGAPDGVVRRDRVCIAEIWQECFGGEARNLDRMKTNELRAIMNRMPGWEAMEKKAWFGPYNAQRGYCRLADGHAVK